MYFCVDVFLYAVQISTATLGSVLSSQQMYKYKYIYRNDKYIYKLGGNRLDNGQSDSGY